MQAIRNRSTLFILALIALAALTGMALVAFATTRGPGVGGDATIYLTTARSLLEGKGLVWPEADGTTRLLPYTPPFYPLMLSGVGLFASNLDAGARWLNVLLFGATIALAGWFFYRFTGRAALAVLLSGLVATSPVLIGVQVWAMSESLFLLLGFAGLFVLLAYFERPRPALLVAAAALAGLAFLTRFIGLAFVATGGLALLIFARGDAAPGSRPQALFDFRWPHLRPAVLYGLLAVLPMLVWLLIDFLLTGTVASRSGQPAEAYLRRLLEMGPALQKIYLFWLLPESRLGQLPGFLQAFLWAAPLLGLLVVVGLIARRAGAARVATQPRLPSAFRLAALMGLFILVYLAVLAVVQVFTYPPVTLAARMLSPVHLAFLVLVLALLHLALLVLFRDARWAVWAGLLLVAVLLGTYLLRGAQVANGYHRGGIGYNMPAWNEAAILDAVRALPVDVPLVSNETTALMYLAGRPAYPLREIYQDHPSEAFSVYGSGADDSQRAFREDGAALVLFYNTLGEDFAMYGERANERIAALTDGLYVYYQGEDGLILFHQPPAFETSGP